MSGNLEEAIVQTAVSHFFYKLFLGSRITLVEFW
jgi:hypothetical protein